jgi:hypothetical protein
MANEYVYPAHNLDPMKKGYDWILNYVRAANAEGQSYLPGLMGNIFYRRLEEIRAYGMGKQPINKYKKRQAGDQINNNTEVNNDYSIVPIICRFREIIISRLMQRQYDLQAFAIDPLSKSKEDAVFNQMKIKIMMREAAKKAGSPLANSPVLKKQAGEPEDEEELAMQMEFGYKDTMCMEAEEAIQLIQQQNDIFERRKRTIENLVDYGIGGYTQWIDENGQCKLREVPVKNLLISFCVNNDFSDAVHWGFYNEVNLIDLAPYFTPDQMDDIQKNVAGKNNNPRMIGTFRRNWAKYKVTVLDFKLLTWDTTVYKSEIDSKGNERFGKTHYQNIQFVDNNDDIDGSGDGYEEYDESIVDDNKMGAKTPKYTSSTRKVMYKTKWIVNTDMMYDYGISENQVRKPSSWWDTGLDVQLYAWNFDNMLFTGITERLIPIADAYYLTWQKLQNLKNKLIPYLIELDLNAIESAAFGAGGTKMTPAEIIDMAYSNFMVLTRKTDLLNSNPNYKAMTIEATGQLAAFQHLYQDLQFCIQQLYDITGLNQITAAGTPNAKTLTSGYDNANIGTDNAIYLLGIADRNLMLRMADNIMGKVQIAVKLGKVEGYMKPLGSETVKFLSINPDLSLIEMGIFLNDAPTVEERQMLYQELTVKETQGLIQPHDKIIVMSCKNLKQAARYLAYITKKRMEEARAAKIQETQMQTKSQTEGLAQLEQIKHKNSIELLQAQIQLENVKGQWVYETEMMKKGSDMQEGAQQAQAKVVSSQIMADAKVNATHIQAGTSLVQTHMDNETKKETKKSDATK